MIIAPPIVSGLVGVGQTWLNNLIGQSVMRDLRDALYEHLQRMPLRFFTETRTGEIQTRLISDVAGVQTVVSNTITDQLSNVVIVVSSVVAMFAMDWRLTLLSLVMVLFIGSVGSFVRADLVFVVMGLVLLAGALSERRQWRRGSGK